MAPERDAEEELAKLNHGAHDSAGVDLTQIDALLRVSPRERLKILYETASSLGRLMPNDDSDPIV